MELPTLVTLPAPNMELPTLVTHQAPNMELPTLVTHQVPNMELPTLVTLQAPNMELQKPKATLLLPALNMAPLPKAMVTSALQAHNTELPLVEVLALKTTTHSLLPALNMEHLQLLLAHIFLPSNKYN
jgi:hypothetical protein